MQRQIQWFNMKDLTPEEKTHYIRVCSYSFIYKGKNCDNPHCTFAHSNTDIDIRMSAKKFMDNVNWKIAEGKLPPWLDIEGLSPEEVHVYLKVCMNIARPEGCSKKNCEFDESPKPLNIKMSQKKLADYYKFLGCKVTKNSCIVDTCDCKSDIQSEYDATTEEKYSDTSVTASSDDTKEIEDAKEVNEYDDPQTPIPQHQGMPYMQFSQTINSIPYPQPIRYIKIEQYVPVYPTYPYMNQ